MAIVRWRDPVNLMPRSLWPGLWADEDFWPEEKDGFTVYETDDDVIAKANVPGIPAENVDVSYNSGVLSIKAEYEEPKKEKGKKKKVYRQAREARYFYTTSIPCPIKGNKIDAEVKDGIVTVTMPKAEESKPKKIKVKQA
jgi:HSP20 family protein